MPGELFVLLVGTVLFNNWSPSNKLDIGYVPNEIPKPRVPCASPFDSSIFTIGLLSYVMVISLAKQFGTIENYPVHPSFEAFGTEKVFSAVINV